MGSDWNPNQPLTPELVKRVLEWMEAKMELAGSAVELNHWVVAHLYVTAGYVVSFERSRRFFAGSGWHE